MRRSRRTSVAASVDPRDTASYVPTQANASGKRAAADGKTIPRPGPAPGKMIGWGKAGKSGGVGQLRNSQARYACVRKIRVDPLFGEQEPPQISAQGVLDRALLFFHLAPNTCQLGRRAIIESAIGQDLVMEETKKSSEIRDAGREYRYGLPFHLHG